jgi:hypothetical protein
MAENETAEQFKDRMRSIGFMSGGRTRDKVRTVTRPENDPGLDAGKKAKQTTDQLGSVITESDHRQDVSICPPTAYTSISITNGEA